jgi:hypothetical protein
MGLAGIASPRRLTLSIYRFLNEPATYEQAASGGKSKPCRESGQMISHNKKTSAGADALGWLMD